ncbi:MAG: superoxide dismutase [Planctomycetota bacterium]|nr:superoxide dismutase [Planctomycetota bacterium]
MTKTEQVDRRAAIGAMAMLGSGLAFAGVATAGQPEADDSLISIGYDKATGEYVLPPLPYDYDALEPHLDAQTMRIHHDKHHAGYVRGLNAALAALAEARASGDASLIQHWTKKVSFHGSGHVNHTLFWLGMAPPSRGGGGEPSGKLADAIVRDFGGFDKFSWQFQAAAKSVEGSGWGWLVHEPISGRLTVLQVENQQKLLMTGCVPLLGIDVWEHAYYLKYQNRRSDYVAAFMHVINWGHVERLYERATG